MSEPTDYVFIHGGGQGGWVWAKTLEAMRAQDHGGAVGRTLTLDVPGCGAKRGRALDDLTMDDVARELMGDIAAVGIEHAILVGHSQAGQLIPAMVRLNPAIFRRLVYVTCSIPLPGQGVHEMFGVGLQGASEDEIGWPFDLTKVDLADAFPRMLRSDMSPAQAREFDSHAGSDNWPSQTYAMTDWAYDGMGLVPATFVICLKDRILPAHWQEIFAQRLKAERLVRIDTGHQVMNARPHALAEVLRLET